MTHGVVGSVVDGVLRVRLDNPKRRNALTRDGFAALADVFARARGVVDVAVVTGAGESFCAGADLSGETGSPAEAGAMLDAASGAVGAIVDFPGVVIAAVNGPAAGAGVSLALACDLAVAADDAYFLFAFTRVGLLPDCGATATLAAAVGRNRALQLALLGGRIDAAQAVQTGLVGASCPAVQLDSRVDEIVARLRSTSAAALRERSRPSTRLRSPS